MTRSLFRRPSLTDLGAVASIANSAYLCFVSLEAFFGLRDAAPQVANFVAVFSLAVATLGALYGLAMIRRLFATDASGASRVAALIGMAFGAMLIAPFVLVGLRISIADLDPQLHMMPFLVLEVGSILYWIQLDRDALAQRRIGAMLSWLGTLLVAMILTGAYSEWLGGGDISDRLRLVYGAILFHLFNACALFHGFVVSREKRLRRERALAA